MNKSTNRRLINLRRAIKRYVDAEVADSWKGGGDPDSYPEIEAELERARALLDKHLIAMEVP